MSARYIVRFDDVCPTMNWKVWEGIEKNLIAMDVRPIVAVVPDNRDPKLDVGTADGEFWDRVRGWQARRWTIGWHGFQHLYETGDVGLLGLNARSEFAGLSTDVQRRKLASAYKIFEENGIRPDLWVAPAHSFDRGTVELLHSFGVRVISDGFFLRPVISLGSLWIPQQLWKFRSRPIGLWTVCCHVNHWSHVDVETFSADLARFSSRLTCVSDVISTPQSERTVLDGSFAATYRQLVILKRRLRA